MKRGFRRPAPEHCRWIDVIGRNRAQLERVRDRLAMPPRLVSLSLAEHLQPIVIPVHSAWFLVTYFTIPSRLAVFKRQPLCVWLAPYALVTISPWARRGSVLGSAADLDDTRDDFLCRLLEAAVDSHNDVVQQLNEMFFGQDCGEDARTRHHREHRLMRFGHLLASQLDFMCAIGLGNAKVRGIHERLSGLCELVGHAEQKLRKSRYCPVCSRHHRVGRRRV